MTITIPDFWCGVITTILFEFVALTVAAAVRSQKRKRNTKYKIK